MKTEATQKSDAIIGLLILVGMLWGISKCTCHNDENKKQEPTVSSIIDSGNARYKREMERQEIERKAAIEAEERRPKTKEEIRLQKTVDKYQCSIEEAQAIQKHKARMGMTKQMVVAACGRPNKINITRNGDFVQEQWVYGDFPNSSYLYFGNEGTLTGYQISE